MRDEKWETIKLASICSDINYGYTQSATTEPIGPKFLRITDIVGTSINWDSVPYCPISDSDKLKYKLNIGDIVIARTGATTGSTATIKEQIDSVFASYLIRYKIDQKLADPFFIGYVLKSKIWEEYVQGIVGGSAQPGANAKQFGEFEFTLPPLPTQRRIAAILTALDDKIELNRRMNETLEGIAQAVWGEWFGKYAGGEEELILLEELIEFNPKIQISVGKEVTYVEMKDLSENGMNVTGFTKRNFSAGSKFQLNDTILARITPCLENGKTAFVNFLEKEEKAFGSTEFITMRGKEGISPYYVYFVARDERFRQFAIGSMVGSSGRQRVQTEILPSFEVAKPSDQKMIDFHGFAKPLFDEIFLNFQQSRTLTALRDALLPRLMRGEFEI